jgi:hypothetical protein
MTPQEGMGGADGISEMEIDTELFVLGFRNNLL